MSEKTVTSDKIQAALEKIRLAQAELLKLSEARHSDPAESAKVPKKQKPKKEPKAPKAPKPKKAPKAPKPKKVAKPKKAPKPKKEKKVKVAKARKVVGVRSGQSGPAIVGLTYEALNANEKRTYDFVEGKRSVSLIEIVDGVFKPLAKNHKQAASWARNSLRRLIRSGMLTKQARGVYSLASKASKAAAA